MGVALTAATAVVGGSGGTDAGSGGGWRGLVVFELGGQLVQQFVFFSRAGHIG